MGGNKIIQSSNAPLLSGEPFPLLVDAFDSHMIEVD